MELTNPDFADPALIAAVAPPPRPSLRLGGLPMKIHTRNSVGKLEELGFDPIAEMVREFDSIGDTLTIMRASGKRSMHAEATLLGLRQKIANDLLKYGYNAAPDRGQPLHEEETDEDVVIQIEGY